MHQLTTAAPLAFAVTMAALSTPGISWARQDLVVGGTATVTGTEGRGLRARSGPGLSYRVLTVLPEGSTVQLLAGPVADGEDDWYQVSTGAGGTGWSLNRYLAPAEPSPTSNQPGHQAGAQTGRTFMAKVTAYANGVGGVAHNARTASGTLARPGVVAVDPRFIPLGSVMTIQGFDGRFVAEDVGGAIRGPMLDVWLADAAAARRFGIQYRSVTVIQEGPARRGT